jgi:hypothetical protein
MLATSLGRLSIVFHFRTGRLAGLSTHKCRFLAACGHSVQFSVGIGIGIGISISIRRLCNELKRTVDGSGRRQPLHLLFLPLLPDREVGRSRTGRRTAILVARPHSPRRSHPRHSGSGRSPWGLPVVSRARRPMLASRLQFSDAARDLRHSRRPIWLFMHLEAGLSGLGLGSRGDSGNRIGRAASADDCGICGICGICARWERGAPCLLRHAPGRAFGHEESRARWRSGSGHCLIEGAKCQKASVAGERIGDAL